MNQLWDERISRLKLHYFTHTTPYSIYSIGGFTAPHGNHYCEDYLKQVSNEEFENILKKEKI